MKTKEQRRVYYAEHREQYKAYNAKWNKAHPEANAKWNKAHPEECAKNSTKRARRFRAANPHYYPQWRKQHPERQPAANARWLVQHPLFKRWQSMLSRCYNPNGAGYKWCGGRGIEVCAEWWPPFENYEKYINDTLGPMPAPGARLYRIDKDGDFEPGNLEWRETKTKTPSQRAADAAARSRAYWARRGPSAVTSTERNRRFLERHPGYNARWRAERRALTASTEGQ